MWQCVDDADEFVGCLHAAGVDFLLVCFGPAAFVDGYACEVDEDVCVV